MTLYRRAPRRQTAEQIAWVAQYLLETPSEWGHTPSELSRATGLSRFDVGQIIQVLEENDYVFGELAGRPVLGEQPPEPRYLLTEEGEEVATGMAAQLRAGTKIKFTNPALRSAKNRAAPRQTYTIEKLRNSSSGRVVLAAILELGQDGTKITFAEVENRCSLTKSAISLIVVAIRRAGWVEAHKDPTTETNRYTRINFWMTEVGHQEITALLANPIEERNRRCPVKRLADSAARRRSKRAASRASVTQSPTSC